MVRHKNSLVLFGGFYDTGYEVACLASRHQLWLHVAPQVNYFNDLHVFDFDKQVCSGVDFCTELWFMFAQEWRKVGDDPRGDNR